MNFCHMFEVLFASSTDQVLFTGRSVADQVFWMLIVAQIGHPIEQTKDINVKRHRKKTTTKLTLCLEKMVFLY